MKRIDLIQGEYASNDVRRRAKPGLPHAVADNHRLPRAIVGVAIIRKPGTKKQRSLEHLKVVGAHKSEVDPLPVDLAVASLTAARPENDSVCSLQ